MAAAAGRQQLARCCITGLHCRRCACWPGMLQRLVLSIPRRTYRAVGSRTSWTRALGCRATAASHLDYLGLTTSFAVDITRELL